MLGLELRNENDSLSRSGSSGLGYIKEEDNESDNGSKGLHSDKE